MSKARPNDSLMAVITAARARRSESEEAMHGEALRSVEASDPLEMQRVIADLGSDWAFVVRVEQDGTQVPEWVGGALSERFTLTPDGEDSFDWMRRVADEDRSAAVSHLERALDRGSDRVEFRFVVPNADAIWVESSIRVVWGSEADSALRIYGSMRDISARRDTEAALRVSESRYRALAEQATEAIFVFGPDGRIESSNPAAGELFGFAEGELTGQVFHDFIHPEDVELDLLSLRNLASGITLRSLRRVRGADGAWAWAELSARRLRDGRVQATARDVTKRVEAENRIRNLAYFDSLTGLPNRELFREQLARDVEHCIKSKRQLALLFLDIDRFKQVNDSLGHSMGDDLLRQVADRLRTVVRSGDSVSRVQTESGPLDVPGSPISRLGGDEFTVLIPGLEHPQDAARVARRVLHTLSRPFDLSGHEVFAGTSVGIAVWPDDGDNAEHLLRSADTAMYHAKGRGGNTYEFFNTSMNVSSSRRLYLETGLRRAVEREEFHLVYQPIRDARSGEVRAVETLLRWTDADGQRIGPDEFIPIAEETGLIVEIGAWVLRSACRQATAWRSEGYAPVRLSVNVAVGQLRDPTFVEGVEQILFDTGFSPTDLELEITESSILDDNPNITAAVGQLTETGIGFALDDFGTGYSSLSALQRFPIDRLKIDRSFVSGVGENANDEALTSAILALASRLDHAVVAEGVETEEQARFLQDQGCDELQGYLFSPPVSPQEVVSYFRLSEKQEGGEDRES